MKIGMDVDGVLRDFTGALKRVYLRDYPDHTVKEVTEWDIDKFYPIGKDIYDYAFKFRAKEIFLHDALPYIGAIGMMKNLKKSGHYIWIVSTQPMGFEYLTTEWLKVFQCPYDSVAVTAQKQDIDCDTFLDDGEHNLRALRDVAKRAICFNRAWNQNWDGERVLTYKQFEDLCNSPNLKK